MKISRFIVTVLFLMYSNCISAAQDTTSVSLPGQLASGTILVLKGNYPFDATELWKLELPFGWETFFLDLRQEGYKISRVRFDLEGRYVFTLEVKYEGDTGFALLGESRIVRLNLETGEREIVLTGVNLVDFALSTDSNRAFVRYFPQNITSLGFHDGYLEEWCFAELTNGQSICHPLELGHSDLRDYVWVDEQTLAYTALPDESAFFLLNTDDMSVERVGLPEKVDPQVMRRMPVTSRILIFAWDYVKDTRMLLTVDPAQKTVEHVGTVEFVSYAMEVSPDEQWVVMGSYDDGILIDLHTGQIVKHYPTMYQMAWRSMRWIKTGACYCIFGEQSYRGAGTFTVIFDPILNEAAVHGAFRQVDGELLIVP